MQSLPNGTLICAHDKKYLKWYKSDGHVKTYIPKKNRQLAEQLALKKYVSLLIDDLSQEILAYDFYLRHHKEGLGQADTLLLANPEYRNLLHPLFKPLSKELSEWQNESFASNPKYPEQLSIKTSSGHLVRSKSEALIDMALSAHKIPFRYECPLELNGHTIYPDFTIRHPHTGKTYYWEHFGLMDKPDYCRNVSSKLLQYSLNGIIPSVHLITTYETQKYPIGTETIEKIIEHYFL